jgi:transcription elongation factor Elf1
MSDLYLQIKYARIVGSSLDRWKITKESPFHAKSRCPICLDSAKSKSLCRFHIREYKDSIFTSCFNCGYSTNLSTFLKVYHTNIYSDYVFERYRVVGKDEEPIIKDTPLEPTRIVSVKRSELGLDYIRDLDKTHPARLYVDSRRIPEYPFMYAEKFYKLASEYNSDIDITKIPKDEPRLIIPFYDRSGNIFAFQGRDLSGKSTQKYITIIIDRKVPKIFGVDRVNLKKPVIIVEGPIDSLFLPNCLAAVNASLVSVAKRIESVINRNLITLVYDNEPRNAQIVSMYADAIKDGYRIVIWPKECENFKDINDMSKAGKDVKKIIENNTYSGLSAQMEFQKWKRI